jgi:hypothetical protein
MHDQGKRLEALTLNEFRQGFDPFLPRTLTLPKPCRPAWRACRNYHRRRACRKHGDAGPPRAYRRLRGNGSLDPGAGRGAGTKNIRVLCVRSHAIADAVQAGSYVGTFSPSRRRRWGLPLSSF